MVTKHILKTDFGVAVELHLNEDTGDFNCAWEGLPKRVSPALRDKVLGVYIPWRNQLIGEWAQRKDKIVGLITL
jgi:hypothetical protein